MTQNLREQHLKNVLEAMISYAAEGGSISFESTGDTKNEVVISFRVGDSVAYDRMLNRIMAESAGEVALRDGVAHN